MNFNNKWNKESYSKYLKYLLSIKDDKVKEFNKKLIITKSEILGIKIPVLRQIAKQIAKTDIDSFLRNVQNIYYEEILVEGFVIGTIKDKDLFIKYFDKFIYKIDNWSVCDSCISSFKIINKIDFFKRAELLVNDNKEFIQRTGIIIMLDYYLDDKHINEVLDIATRVKSDYYYVNMAISWLISASFVKYRTLTLELIKRKNLPTFVQNKAIQKIRESYKVEKADKEMLLKYKL